MQMIRATNRYFESSAPWALVKEDKPQAGTVLKNCIEALRISAVVLYPIMPGKTIELLTRIGEPIEMLKLKVHSKWGLVRTGALMHKGDALFPRLEEKVVRAALSEYIGNGASQSGAAPSPTQADDRITIEDFRKIELRTATVLAAESIPGSDKLLKLQVQVGEEKRQIVAGIAEYYSAASVVGQRIVVVANLKPAKLRGETSEGMLLAVKWDKELKILSAPDDAPNGSAIN